LTGKITEHLHLGKILSHLEWGCCGALVSLLWLPELKMLWVTWHGDESLSHGPLIILLSLALFWMRRSEMRRSITSTIPGGVWLALSLVLYVGGVWADVAFIRLLCLISMLGSLCLFLGGWKTLQAAGGALGLLVFMIPWPMTFVEHLAFPLQITSSSYAGLLAGLCGVPIVRDGVYVMVVPDPAAKPIYTMMVAQKCSGLTSLTVLLALAYIVAYYTPLKWNWRVLMVALVLPLTLVTNSLRLTVILLAGNYHSPALASWIHDHETPVLISLCSMALMGIRGALLTWKQRESEKEGGALVKIASAASEHDVVISSAG
jgi:exosortase